jgi:ubiquitin carboxyl-terminal hydrolase 1
MTPQRDDFQTYYDARVQAHRQAHASSQVWDRYTQPSVLLPVLILALTVIYQRFGARIAPDGIIPFVVNSSWDALVYMMPRPLLEAIDSRCDTSLVPRPASETTLDTHAAKSKAMRRVLGLDRSGGMMATVFQARNRALSVTGSALGLKANAIQPPGLGNRDNSCYQNSILQSLASLQPLPDYLERCLRSVDKGNENKEVAQTLKTLVSALNDASNNGRTLWTPSLLKSMSTWTQQDAQEYFSKVLDDIDKGLAKSLQSQRSQTGFESDSSKDETVASQHSDDSGYQSQSSSAKSQDAKPIRNPLEGLLAQRVSCVQCGHSDGLSMTPFNCLTLSLELDRGFYDLHDRMNAYSKLELIEGVECPRCTLLKAKRLLTRLVDSMQEKQASEAMLAEPSQRLEAVETALEEDDFSDETLRDRCKISSQAKVTTTKTKQIVIARPPQSLAIHMNRSVFDPRTFDMMKNSAPVGFPLTLDLGPYCLGSASAPEQSSDEDLEHWQLDAKASMIAGDRDTSKLVGPIYELKAAVTHSGRHENGHYICYRKYPCNEPPIVESAESEAEDSDSDPNVDSNSGEAQPEDAERVKTRKDEPAMQWWRLSDDNVSKVDESFVLSLSPGVFMLFYDCVDPNMVLQSRDDDLQSESTDEKSMTEDPGLEEEDSAGNVPAAVAVTSDGDGHQLSATMEGEK